MYRSSSFRSTLNTSYIRGLGMCKVCTEAVHSEALWTRVTSEVWAMCEVCTEAVVFHSSTLLSFYSSILLLFRSVALLCCCSSILLARRNLASSSFSIDRLTSADLGWPRLTSADLGWPRLTSTGGNSHTRPPGTMAFSKKRILNPSRSLRPCSWWTI